MPTILNTIAAHAAYRVAQDKLRIPAQEMRERALALGRGEGEAFRRALAEPGLSVICEVKKASPSRGVIAEDFPYLDIAREYAAAGADAISCLTEPKWFLGSDRVFAGMRAAVHTPMLRKDFVVDDYQLYQSRCMGANAVLLISALHDTALLKRRLAPCEELGLCVLVETHDEGEFASAVAAGARVIGVTTDRIFDMVRELRRDTNVPMVFMTYANVVYSYGTERFLRTCAEIGVDGLILPDVPFEEKDEFAPLCRRFGVELISLIAPTSENRIAMIAREAEGFLYIVSSLGVTGVRSEITTYLGAMVRLVRQVTDVPCAIGFGISTPDQAQALEALADGAIVGSAIVKLIAEHGEAAAPYAGAYVKAMKDAVARA